MSSASQVASGWMGKAQVSAMLVGEGGVTEGSQPHCRPATRSPGWASARGGHTSAVMLRSASVQMLDNMPCG